VLLSQAAWELARGHLPEGVAVIDLGERRLRDLSNPEHIYQLAAPGILADFPPLKTLDVLSGELPSQSTAFIGRESELEQIEAMLSNPECRLVTLVGIGGIGKTRLAIQAAAQSQIFAHNACFIALASAHTPDEMILAIAQSLQFNFQIPPDKRLNQAESQEQLFQYLADKKGLLVLDNFEHLVGCADFVGELLTAAPRLKLIVTTRERLNLPGEWVLNVVGLPFPGKQVSKEVSDYAAVQLFLHGAERSSRFIPTEGDWSAITRICQLVEGMPLGVEMAAAWVKMLSCAEIAAEIEHDLDFLTVSWHGMPERQQTLRAVFEYSWYLLSEQEQDGFASLAVFDGGFTRQAAQEVAGVSILLLAALADKSFLRRTAPGRYEIHPVLKQYGQEKLAARPALLQEARQLQAEFYSEWLCQMGEKLKGAQQLEALTALRADARNLRVALEWLVQQRDYDRIEAALPVVILLNVMNDQQVATRTITQILQVLLPDLAAAPERSALFTLVLATLRIFPLFSGNIQIAESYQRQCLQRMPSLPEDKTKAYALVLICIGPTQTAVRDLLDAGMEGLSIFQRLEDAWGCAISYVILGDIENFGQSNLEKAQEYYLSGMKAFTSLENDWGRSLCLVGLTMIARKTGRLQEAYKLGQESMAILARLTNIERLLFVRHMLGEIAMQLNLPGEAREYFNANLAYHIYAGDENGQNLYAGLLEQLDQAAKLKS
jgi:predicted ATPase